MNIPEAVIWSDTMPETECLALFPGAVIGAPEDPAAALLRKADAVPGTDEPLQELFSTGLPAGHVLAGAALPLDSKVPDTAALFKRRLNEAISLADTLGAVSLSLLALPADTFDSRLFAFNTVLFRVLMQNREDHPCLGSVRFLCRNKAEAEWLARAYNFYYPGEKSERMSVPGSPD